MLIPCPLQGTTFHCTITKGRNSRIYPPSRAHGIPMGTWEICQILGATVGSVGSEPKRSRPSYIYTCIIVLRPGSPPTRTITSSSTRLQIVVTDDSSAQSYQSSAGQDNIKDPPPRHQLLTSFHPPPITTTIKLTPSHHHPQLERTPIHSITQETRLHHTTPHHTTPSPSPIT